MAAELDSKALDGSALYAACKAFDRRKVMSDAIAAYLEAAALPAPAVPKEDAVLRGQSDAWFAVADELNAADPEWLTRSLRGMDAAVASIRYLASRTLPAPRPREEGT